MSRRLLAALALAAALGPLTAQPAEAAYCGPVLDYVGGQLPAPARAAYWKVCGP
jgi:hypothetical protein